MNNPISTKLFTLLLSLFFGFVVIPILTILFTPIYLFRFVISKLAKYIRPDLGNILSPESVLQTFDKWNESNPACVIVVVLKFTGNISVNSIRKTYTNRILPYKLPNGELRYEELKQYPVDWMGFKFWKNDRNFNISNHVKSYQESDLNDLINKEIITDADVKTLEQNALEKPFAKNQSPWDLLVVNNYYPEEDKILTEVQTVLIMRVHHTLGDGYSFMKLIIEGLYGQDMKKISETDSKRNPRKINILSLITFPFRAIFEASGHILKLAKPSVFNIPAANRTQSFVSVTNKINLDGLKQFKKLMNVSLSSVILSACTKAIKETMTKKDIAVPDDILCILPCLLPPKSDRLSNNFSNFMIPLPTTSEINNEERILQLDKSYRSVLISTSPIFNTFLGKVFGRLFTPMVKIFTSGLVPPVLLSNFPANFSNMEYEGHPNVDTHYYCGLCNLPSLSFFVSSFNGWMRVTVVVEAALLSSDEAQMLANIIEEVLQIYAIEMVQNSLKIKKDISILMPA